MVLICKKFIVTASKAVVAATPIVEHKPVKKHKAGRRCDHCNKPVAISAMLQCRCGKNVCTKHRYPDDHGCTFDYRQAERARAAQAIKDFQPLELKVVKI
jgi:hypothetical protein